MIQNFAPSAPAVSHAGQARRLLTDKTQEIYGLLRELRRAAGLSLTQAEEKFGLAAVVIGSYERGDRNPNVDRLNMLLDGYGYELAAIPRGATVIPPTGTNAQPRVWTDEALADALRSISGHLDTVLGRDGRDVA